MTLTGYLEEVRAAALELQRQKKKIDSLVERAASLGGTDYSRDRVQVSHPGGAAAYSGLVEHAVDLEREAKETAIHRAKLWGKVSGQLRQELTEKQFEAVSLYYRIGAELPQVARAMCCDLDTATAILDSAVGVMAPLVV